MGLQKKSLRNTLYLFLALGPLRPLGPLPALGLPLVDLLTKNRPLECIGLQKKPTFATHWPGPMDTWDPPSSE